MYAQTNKQTVLVLTLALLRLLRRGPSPGLVEVEGLALFAIAPGRVVLAVASQLTFIVVDASEGGWMLTYIRYVVTALEMILPHN